MNTDDKSQKDETLDSALNLKNNDFDSSQSEKTSSPESGESLQATLAKTLAERQEYLDGWQRLKADVANLKKNESARLSGALEAGKEAVLEAILPSLDGFEMAIKSPSWETVDKAWRAGMEGVYAQLQSSLRQIGALPFGAVGDLFDPGSYEPVATEETDDESKDGRVTAVLGVGWKLGDKILRPARVKIAHRAQ